ncbi:MAG: hypothetical protein WCG27_12195, partial [Pseudomonadota bacterium]
PLRSLEQTLTEQKKSLVAPVGKSLEALAHCLYTDDFAANVKEDFLGAGIEAIHEQFVHFHEFSEKQRESFVSEIERLEGELTDAHQLINGMKQIFTQKEKVQTEAVPYFKAAKENVIELVDARKEVEQLCLNAVVGSKNLLQEEMHLLAQAKTLEELLEENIQAFDNMGGNRQEFKTIKRQVEDSKCTLMQTIDQAMVLKKTERWCPEKMEQIMGRIKMEVKSFESVLTAMGKLLMGLDVQLSKLQLITENHQKADIESYRVRFEDLRDRIENSMFQMSKLARRGEQADKGMIQALKDLFCNFNVQKEQLQKLKASVGDTTPTGRVEDLGLEDGRGQLNA